MSSKVLYAPIVKDYQPAFMAKSSSIGSNSCKIYFTLSKFNSFSDFKNVQLTVKKQDTGLSVVDAAKDFQSTGTILNLPVHVDAEGTYVEITDANLKSVATINSVQYKGWIPSWIYKIQLRLSNAECPDSAKASSAEQYRWLNNSASYFSEWSTVCIIKCIGDIEVTIPSYLNFNSLNPNGSSNTLSSITYIDTLTINGTFSSLVDKSEYLYSYSAELWGYDKKGKLYRIDASGDLYPEQTLDSQTIRYDFKYAGEFESEYVVKLTYTTNNLFTETFSFDVSYVPSFVGDTRRIYPLVTNGVYEELPPAIRQELAELSKSVPSSLSVEEEDGFICIKLYEEVNAGKPVSGTNVVLRRTDSKTNFAIWEDVKIIPVSSTQTIAEIKEIYDFTIESGVFYKYAVQLEDEAGNRTPLFTDGAVTILRTFEYSYLLGKNNQQLKLKFDNMMNSFKTNYSEAKLDTLGSVYPSFARNGDMKYRSFPITGLISLFMDDNSRFITKEELYGDKAICDRFDYINTERNINSYLDYTYERDFRKAVMEFLEDGEPKLFKSPSEGNIIIRLMDCNETPNKSLNRMLYSFSANAYEKDEFNLNNCSKYGFIEIGNPLKSFATEETRIGQLVLKNAASGTDLMELIRNKYNFIDTPEKANKTYELTKLMGVTIEATSSLQQPGQSNLEAGGYPLTYNGTRIIVKSANGFYNFGEADLNTNNAFVIGDAGSDVTYDLTVNFVYSVVVDDYKGRQIQYYTTYRNVGQYAEKVEPGTSIYNGIYNKYYYETEEGFRKLYNLRGISLQADPGTIFVLNGVELVMNQTGLFNFMNLADIGSLVYSTKNKNSSDVIVDYYLYIQEGTYSTALKGV